jgi:hypothetical protein
MKEHLFQLIRTANPVRGHNIVREHLQARILEALQRAGAMVPLAIPGKDQSAFSLCHTVLFRRP